MLNNRSILSTLAILVTFCISPFSALAEIPEHRLQVLEEKYKAYSKALSVFERFCWNGDLRTRYQSDFRDQTTSNVLDRHRFRLRFRLNGNVHLSKGFDIGFRLVTGDLGNQTSTNSTLSGGFGNKSFDLDRAYFKWNPKPFQIQGGKFAVPFMKSELIWDSDVNVEGASEQFVHKTGSTKLELVLGQFIIDEFNPGDDIKIFAYQGILEQKTEFGKFKAAIGYYNYVDHEDPASAPTNSVSNNTLSQIKVLDIMGEWSEKVYGQYLTLFGEYAQNTGTLATGNADLDTAWQVGAKYGKSGRNFGDFDLKFIYRTVQQEAVLDTLADSDFHSGVNNARGIEAGGSIGLHKGVKLAFTYFDTQEERGAKDEKQTFQADLMFKF
jgi:hypothetical protein